MLRWLSIVTLGVFSFGAVADEIGDYLINPGDGLEVFVWKEEEISRSVVVRPDGFISLPLVGEIRAGGQVPAAVGSAIAEALSSYLNDEPEVTVTLLSLEGNVVYVIGKVNRPGAYPVARQVDVAQALASAGGLNAFADEDEIRVLRRHADGSQVTLDFDYGALKQGKNLVSNIILQSGDVVIVP